MEIKIREKFEEEITKKEKELAERESEIRKKEEEITKRVKRMVEMESKIREREIKVEKRKGEILRKEKLEKRKEENKRERLEKMRLEEKRKKEEEERIEKEKIRVEEEEKMRLEEEEKKLEEIARAGREHLTTMQAQMEALQKVGIEEEVKMPQVFDGTSSKVSRFVEDCRRYTERKMKKEVEEDKICWIVSYVQGDRTDKWKERIVDEMFEDKWKNRKVEDILKEIKKEFGKGKKIEEYIWKGLDSFGGKGMDGFWNVVKGKEEEIVKKKPKIEAMTLRIPTVGKGSGFKKR